jgi:hypothetical protein
LPFGPLFRILDKQDKVDLTDTTFPAGRNDALQWNVKSQVAGKIPVEIRYFTSGITWAADNVGIANVLQLQLKLRRSLKTAQPDAHKRKRITKARKYENAKQFAIEPEHGRLAASSAASRNQGTAGTAHSQSIDRPTTGRPRRRVTPPLLRR